jgi:hypothetical protein
LPSITVEAPRVGTIEIPASDEPAAERAGQPIIPPGFDILPPAVAIPAVPRAPAKGKPGIKTPPRPGDVGTGPRIKTPPRTSIGPGTGIGPGIDVPPLVKVPPVPKVPKTPSVPETPPLTPPRIVPVPLPPKVGPATAPKTPPVDASTPALTKVTECACPAPGSKKDKERKKKYGCRQGYFRETEKGINYITWSTRHCQSSKTNSLSPLQGRPQTS